MGCNTPLLSVKLGMFDGKYMMKILPARIDLNLAYLEEKYGKENICLLPCGRCLDCKASHRKMWALRCELESLYYKDCCMVTLTYNNRYCPKKLNKSHVRDFIKALRNRGIKFRFFAAGEYGTENHRPHYHLLLFGYFPGDAKYYSLSKSGFPSYRSKFISDCWEKGLVDVTEFGPGSAYYVAGYCDKKLNGDEFLLMSTQPGIGARYFEEHAVDIYRYDNIVIRQGVSRVPRYFDRLAEKSGFDLTQVKSKRLEASNESSLQYIRSHGLSYKDQVFAVKQEEAVLREKKRSKRL